MTATVSFAGVSLDVAPYHIVTIEGLADLPDIRSGDMARVARGGLVEGEDIYGGRTVTITLNVLADTQAAFNAAVNALSLAFSAPALAASPLTFTIPGVAGGTEARVYVKPRRRALPIPSLWFANTTPAVVELAAADPLLYSESETAYTLTVAVPATGRSYSRTYDMTYGASGTLGAAYLVNAGNITTPVLLRIFGPVSNPTVTNVTTGQVLSLTTTLTAGEYVDIDTNDRTVLLGGTADRYSWLTTPQWWGLRPGLNEVRYTAAGSDVSQVQIFYRSAWT